ncbi:MAG: tannase/feruloyl esterase family alpha/beta hydrolase [Acidobacteriaceae bacterium]|nr:tannase/feruloyl esterase family alpha/beta hydrolase [Acidobacteriaceae bacterium]
MRSATAHPSRLLLLLAITVVSVNAATSHCEGLLKAALPNTTITTGESVPAGKFTPPYGNGVDVPEFCRVAGVLRPSSDSYIRFEVWLPTRAWNGKYLGVGNGGFAGSIDYRAMSGNLKRGYATAATDTGHEADAADASWAYGHPDRVIAFGYRALHETTANAKLLIQAFYGRAPEHSYFDSCSDGGREALIEAQRFPEDFDGILAGAPANAWNHLLTAGLDVTRSVLANPAGYISSNKLPAITSAVMKACGASDGVKAGFLNDPERCHFDASVLLCKGVESRSCLTAPQIASLKKIYTGGEDSRGHATFPGLVPGSEDPGWADWVLGFGPGGSFGNVYVENYFRYMVYNDPSWNVLTANVEKASHLAVEKTARALDATDPDLHRFSDRGGKLILYHGWNDPAISPWATIAYYQSVVSKMGAQNAAKFVRLYMVPGVQHCFGGPGPTSFGQLGTTTAKGPEHGVYAALEAWVEDGTAPKTMIGTKYNGNEPAKGVQITRPLCAYPQIAKYGGTGDPKDAANWSCASALTP